MSTELQAAPDNYVFGSIAAFEMGQRMIKPLSESSMVPKDYQGNAANCLIAFEISQRLKASPLMIMQNLDIIYGRPSWRSQFIIASINTCGRFEPLNYELTGEMGQDGRECIAWTIKKGFTIPDSVYAFIESEALKGNPITLFKALKKFGMPVLEAPEVSIKMAKDEGWYAKNGSKWKTMPELMLRYRSAAFFGRLYSPEILMGMSTVEESEDVGVMRDVTPYTPKQTLESTSINEILRQQSNPEETGDGGTTPAKDRLNASIDEAMAQREATADNTPPDEPASLSDRAPLEELLEVPADTVRTGAELQAATKLVMAHMENTPQEWRQSILDNFEPGLLKALADKGLGRSHGDKIRKLLEA